MTWLHVLVVSTTDGLPDCKCAEVRLTGTPEDDPRTDLHVEGRNSPRKVGKLSEDRPSPGWSMSAWYRVTKPGLEETGTLCPSYPSRARPILLQYDYSKLGIFDIYQV
jgi:hypothetical protein